MNTDLKRRVVRRLIVICSISFMSILLLLPLHAFISTWLGTAIGPLLIWKSWKEILLALLVPVAVAYFLVRPEITRQLWSRLINKLILLYVALHLVLTIFSTASNGAVIAGLLMNLRFLAMFVLAQILVAENPSYLKRLKQLIPAWLFWTAIGLSVFAIIQVTVLPKHFLDIFGYNKDTTIAPLSIVDNDPNALRAFATMRGPNTLGAYLLIPLAFATYFVIKKRHLLFASATLALSLVALFLTDSRSAWIGFIGMLCALGLSLFPRDKLKFWIRRAAIPALIGLSLLVLASLSIPAVRLVVFHSTTARPSLIQGSTQDHWLATLNGVKDIIVNPLGTGPGSAGPASFYNKNAAPRISEDYFVQIGQEVGVAGLALFLAINILVGVYLLRAKTTDATLLLAAFIGLSIVNIFLHGWADDPTAMTWWGLAGLYMARDHDNKHSNEIMLQ